MHRPKICFGKITLAAPSSSSSSSSSSSQQPPDPTPAADEDDGDKDNGGFGTFGAPFKPPPPQQAQVVLTEEEEEMQKAMGFHGFGSSKREPLQKKAAKTFDVKEMVDAIKKANRQKRINSSGEEVTDSVIVTTEHEKEVKDKKDTPKKPAVVEPSKPPEGESDDDEDLIGPMPPPPTSSAPKTKKADDDDDDDSSSSSDEDEKVSTEKTEEDVDSDVEAENFFPLEFQYTVEHGMRPVTALAVDLTATRFATGSLDYEVKLWDFTGLRNKHPFRTVKPCENHPIKHLSFAANGESVLVVSGSAQAKVLNKEGSELLECVKGDQYIVDMARTSGHTACLTGGMFNPKNKSEFMTASDDSTVRLWEVNNSRSQKTLVKLKNAGGLKTRVTACTYSGDGCCFMGGGSDGTICMWDTRRPIVLPTATIKNAHQKNTDIFHVAYSNSSQQVASRGEDGVVNIFDVRKWKQPILKSKLGEFPAKYFTTDLSWSPDDRHLLIPTLPEGTTGRTKDEAIVQSSLKFMSLKTLQVVREYVFPKMTVIRSAWPHRINQILVTFASGNIGILYDTEKSQRGALLAHGKAPKKQRMMGVVEDTFGKVVITPNALPLYKTERVKNPKREEAKMRADPVKSRRPDLPITAGSGGRVAASGSTLSSYVVRNLGISKSVKDPEDMDARQAILRYAKAAEENPIWVTPAYKKTQPKPIFTSSTDTEETPPEAKKTKLI